MDVIQDHSAHDDDYDLAIERNDGFSFLQRPTTTQHVEGDGTIVSTFEVPQETGEGDDEENGNWWSADQLRQFLDNYLFTSGLPNVGDLSDFDKRISVMSVIARLPRDAKNGGEGANDGNGEPVIYKRIRTPGYGERVQIDSTVSFHMTGFIENADEPFDSSELRNKPFLTRLSKELVLPGIFIALTSMKVGERSEFIIEPSMAFGSIGAPPRIPPDSRILYIISVRRIHAEGTIENYLTMTYSELLLLPFEKIVQVLNEEKKSGNSYFKALRFEDAFKRYTRAITFLKNLPPFRVESEFNEAKQLMVKLYTNGANVALKTDRAKVALNLCDRALDLDPKNSKALFFSAKAHFMMDQIAESRSQLEKLDSDSLGIQEVLDLLYRIAKREKDDAELSKNLAKRMGSAFKL